MEINRVADAREQRGDNVGLAVDGKSDVAYKTFVENCVNRFAVVSAAMRFANNARALRRRRGFWHDSPHGETWREAGRLFLAHLICSRRQSGMSEEQLQVSYHGRSSADSRRTWSAGRCGSNLDAATSLEERQSQVIRVGLVESQFVPRPYNVQATYEKLAARRSRPLCGRKQKMSTPVMQSAETKALDIEWVSEQFPALKLQVNGYAAEFLDGPAGTQVPKQVMDAIQNYFLTANANTYGAFVTSRRNDEMILSARAAMADFFNCDSNEVVFGQNMTTITFALARAIGRELKADDEIVVTTLDHDANVAPWRALEEN